ncbi:GNAT family N-acetyltransferase [Oceanithermus sp.]|uniref:GNAT family N-acetyltransferase n=1 Tax=Oceanithermus sp. TaxID=2268145 RepID=UPI0025ED800E|nr:GNAT family N-acetyltransferase [Oceanithermus sp.]
MAQPTETAVVRPATPDDLEAVGRISHRTGLLGEPIGPHFPDAALWTDVFVRPFLEAGCCNFVAEVEGEVVAYIIGSCDPEAFGRWLRRRLPGLLLGRWLAGAYPRWWRDLPYLWRAWRMAGPEAPWSRYPAQLHINALPEARGHGVGRALMERFLDCLRARGVPGVQLGTTARNTAALHLYEKFGFRVYARRRSAFWKPIVGEEVEHLRLVKELA